MDCWRRKKSNDSEFLVNPDKKNVLIDGLKLPGIALRHPNKWSKLGRTNWPDREGKWLDNFQFQKDDKFKTYDGGPAYKHDKSSSVLPGHLIDKNQTTSSYSSQSKLSPDKDIPPRPVKPRHHKAVQLSFADKTMMNTEPKSLGSFAQSQMDNLPLENRVLSVERNEPDLRPAEKRVRLAEPRAHQEANFKIEELDSPTPEMIENNVFKADESGRTNITEEAKLWKKNKKLALKLIDLAGRKNEFPTAFDEEMGSVNWPRFA